MTTIFGFPSKAAKSTPRKPAVLLLIETAGLRLTWIGIDPGSDPLRTCNAKSADSFPSSTKSRDIVASAPESKALLTDAYNGRRLSRQNLPITGRAECAVLSGGI